MKFLSTSPLRGTTIFRRRHTADIAISIHVPLAGDDRRTAAAAGAREDFYPRPPCGGRQAFVSVVFGVLDISIHVPLAGDDPVFTSWGGEIYISIHVPLAGDDCSRPPILKAGERFLSTSPLRGTTRTAKP